MTLARWHVVVILALVLFSIAALVLGDKGIDAMLNQTEGGERGASLDAGRGTNGFWANAADIATVATAFATVVATIGGLYLLTVAYRQLRESAKATTVTSKQLRLSANTARADFWLHLREMFEVDAHKKVHLNLMPKGEWWDAGQKISGTPGKEEKFRTELDKNPKKGDRYRYEVPWAKDKVVKEDEGLFVVPWSGVKQEAQCVPKVVDFYMNLNGPKGDQWRDVEAYMGLFEHCEDMLRNGLIDLETFKDIYEYRLVNIMSNRKIVITKLGCRPDNWQRFIRLLNLVEIEVPPKENLMIEELCDVLDKNPSTRHGA